MSQMPATPVVRIAPSPTGAPHVGTAYQALFDYACARRQGGRFILRIEDTDQTRYTPDSEAAIMASLQWLGLEWDEGPDRGGPHAPYRQTERREIYHTYAQMLLETGGAYSCFCTRERLAEVRARQEAAKQPTGYDRHCRYLDPAESRRRAEGGEEHVLRLAMPLEGETTFTDLVRGDVTFQNEKIDDQVLMKTDGLPTYHFAVVVDDRLMEVNLVIRAEEWISSTPKHIQLYKAFGWELPLFAHMPLLRNADRSKLSKRKNPTSLLWFKERGYLPEALLNFLALQGWSMPDGREIFSLAEFVDAFTFDRVATTGPIFDLTKLDNLNGHYLRALSLDELVTRLQPHLPAPALAAPAYTRQIVPLLHDRLVRLADFAELASFFFVADDALPLDPALLVPKRVDREMARDLLAEAVERLAAQQEWGGQPGDAEGDEGEKPLEEILRALAADRGVKAGDLFMILRVAITGSTATPPLFETMTVLGRDRVLARLRRARGLLSGEAPVAS